MWKTELTFTYLKTNFNLKTSKMIKQFLASLEDPNRPLLAPNYWILKKIGLILPKNKIAKAAYVFLHILVTFFVISQYVELYLIRSNLDLVLTNLKISMLSIVCVVKANTFILWESHWLDLIDYITEADKYERGSRDNNKRKIIDSYTKYCRNITYFYWFLLVITFIAVICTPLLFLSSSTFRQDFRNGTELFPHIFSSWMPFDKYHSPGNWLTVVWHICMNAYGGTLQCAYDTMVIVAMVFFAGKLELLRESCKQMLGSSGTGVSDEQASKKIRKFHDIHLLLTKYSRLFNSLLSPVMFVYVVMCALCLCSSAFQLTLARNMTQKLLMVEYLIFGVAQLFLFCWHSNTVMIKSENVIYGPYESEWWAANVRQRKGIHILAGQLRIRYIFSAGPFTDLTLSTFITILKGAYSYYTLLTKG